MKGAHRYGLGLACGLFACLTSVASIAATGDAAGSDLGVALSQLAKAAKIELLFDRSIVIGKRAGAVRHTGTADETLAQLLAGSGLEFQRLPSGAYVVRRSTAVTPRSGDAPELVSTTPVMVPEVLVIGRRSINADLPRRPDDIQPYHVIGSGEIEREQPFSVDEIFADDLPANAQAGSLTQDPQGNQGTARSQIDIHGLGPDQTLVLVDGRRMPSNPSIDHFIQPDLNGLPVTAIDRVETLDATAGGIFGLGATGGVVNVVLKRDFSGVELSGGNGISAHGDGERWNLDGRVGFTSPDDQTHIMILGGLSEDEGITLGQRSFSETEIRLQQQLSPNADDPPVSSDINFSSLVPGTETAGGQILTLKPAYGGGSLNATTTYLPFNAPALTDGGLAILKANAGKYGTALSPDGQGVDQSLVTPTRSRAFVGSFWHDFGPRIDAFVDLLWLDDEGLAKEPVLDTSFAELSSIQPSDPFTEPVVVSFPTPGAVNEVHNETVTARATIGVVARLGGDWTLGLDGSLGQTKVEQNETLSFRPSATFDLVDGPAALEAQLAQLPTSPNVFMKSSDQLEDANLRLGGPLWALPGGPLSVTVTGEFRRETNPGAFGYAVEAPYQWEVVPGLVLNIPGEVIKQQQLGQKQQVGSAFAEIRAPLTSKDFSVWPFKSLELQLALRYDNYRTTEPAAAGAAVLQGPRLISNADAIISQTFGAKVTPASGWTLRASVANGYSPPTAEQLVPFDFSVLIVDPKRGGAAAGGYDVDSSLEGSPTLRPQQVRTLSFGTIMEPPALPGFRLSVDYSLLQSTGEITNFAQGDAQYFVDNEARYPGRVVRAPLTPKDAAFGYTGGQIVSIDASSLETGRSTEQFVDFDFGYRRKLSMGQLRVYSQATWTPTFSSRGGPGQPVYSLVNRVDGPLSLRGRAGVAWDAGRFSNDFSAQFFGGYVAAYGMPTTPIDALPDVQPDSVTKGPHVPAQVYLDWNMSFCPKTELSDFKIRTIVYHLSVKNILDTRPPAIISNVPPELDTLLGSIYYQPFAGYSPFGDPRGRYFEISATVEF